MRFNLFFLLFLALAALLAYNGVRALFTGAEIKAGKRVTGPGAYAAAALYLLAAAGIVAAGFYMFQFCAMARTSREPTASRSSLFRSVQSFPPLLSHVLLAPCVVKLDQPVAGFRNPMLAPFGRLGRAGRHAVIR